jgi:hypothetical protein
LSANKGEKLEDVKNAVLAFYDAAIKKPDGVVFVHCAAGKSRSVAVGLMIMHFRAGLSLKEAFQLVFAERAVIEPNLDLWQQLVAMTHAPASLTQDSCKVVALVSANSARSPDARKREGADALSPAPRLVAENVEELKQVFASCAAVRKKAFHVQYLGKHVTAELMEVLIAGRPRCVSIVALSAQCVYDDPAFEAVLKRKLCFVFS